MVLYGGIDVVTDSAIDSITVVVEVVLLMVVVVPL